MAVQFPVSCGVVLNSSVQCDVYEHLLLVRLKTSSHCIHVIWEKHLPLPSFGDPVCMDTSGIELQVGSIKQLFAVAQFVPRMPTSPWDALLLLTAQVLMRLGRLARRMQRTRLEQHLMRLARAALTTPVNGVMPVSAPLSAGVDSDIPPPGAPLSVN
ncbi:MAG: hypothetical protein JOY60_14060 [Burkholderiaceae bacterium]|nr:hypothetical protein [Burkholderiaceae bacterium]